MQTKIEYLMFDGTIKTELKEEDQINCKGILTHIYFDTTDEMNIALAKFKAKRDEIIIDSIIKGKDA